MKFTNHYRNQKWLYTVYKSESENNYLLVAVVPGIGWFDIALILKNEEVERLRKSEDDFTKFVNHFIKSREEKKFKSRRIEQNIKNIDSDTVELLNEKP